MTMRSRRNLLDEIDASILRLVRSRARVADARRLRLVRLGPPVGHMGLRSTPWRRIRHGVSEMSADRWAPRTSRAAVRRPINVGLSQRTRGEPEWVSPREPAYCSTGSGMRSRRPVSTAFTRCERRVIAYCRSVRSPLCRAGANTSGREDWRPSRFPRSPRPSWCRPPTRTRGSGSIPTAGCHRG